MKSSAKRLPHTLTNSAVRRSFESLVMFSLKPTLLIFGIDFNSLDPDKMMTQNLVRLYDHNCRCSVTLTQFLELSNSRKI